VNSRIAHKLWDDTKKLFVPTAKNCFFWAILPLETKMNDPSANDHNPIFGLKSGHFHPFRGLSSKNPPTHDRPIILFWIFLLTSLPN
jgi:hypothetical protein